MFYLKSITFGLAFMALCASLFSNAQDVFAANHYQVTNKMDAFHLHLNLDKGRLESKSTTNNHFKLQLHSNSPLTINKDLAFNKGLVKKLKVFTFENQTFIELWTTAAYSVRFGNLKNSLELHLQKKTLQPHLPSLHHLTHHFKPSHRKTHTKHLASGYKQVAPGVLLASKTKYYTLGHANYKVLMLDPYHVRVKPVVATGHQLKPLSALARFHGAIAGLNGAFFSPRNGAPQGTLVLDEKLVSRTMLNRPAIWFHRDGGASIGQDKPKVYIRTEDEFTLVASAVNETAKRNAFMLYTPHFGLKTHTHLLSDRYEIALNSAGQVINQGYGNLTIPRDGYVLSAQGRAATALSSHAQLNDHLKIGFSFNQDVRDALGGGPRLLKNGHLVPLSSQQRYASDITRGRAPRSAVGIRRDGKFILVCVDGRGRGGSAGASIRELAFMMRDLGCVDALNLDGGGSSAMYCKGRTINRPSDGYERPIATALLVLPRAQAEAHLPNSALAYNNIISSFF